MRVWGTEIKSLDDSTANAPSKGAPNAIGDVHVGCGDVDMIGNNFVYITALSPSIVIVVGLKSSRCFIMSRSLMVCCCVCIQIMKLNKGFAWAKPQTLVLLEARMVYLGIYEI